MEQAQALTFIKELFESSTDAIVLARADGSIMEANSRAEIVFGYSLHELLTLHVKALLPELPVDVIEPEEAVDSHGSRKQIAGRLIKFATRKDGSDFPANVGISQEHLYGQRLFAIVIRDTSQEMHLVNASEKRSLLNDVHIERRLSGIIGQSQAIQQVLQQIEIVAPTDAAVLIFGETGTGKELVARALHQHSLRRDRAMVTLNCGSIPSELLESELFGHEKGAFTGAIHQRIGRIELAHNGTLFLDEIGDLPPELQPKLLRALQEKEIERLGGTRTISVNFRLLAATHRDLTRMVHEGTFRSDLYYRLKVFPILIPPLRQRQGDIPELVAYFIAKHALRMHKPIETIPDDVIAALMHYQWPGNIRELDNFLERAVILTRGSSLQAPLGELQIVSDGSAAEAMRPESSERANILQMLKETGGVIGGPGGAAKRLGLKRTTLNSKLKKMGIERRRYLA
jgi:PAS domain S-box-containing protein